MRRRIWIPEAPFISLRRYVEIEAVRHRVGVSGLFRSIELVHARTGLVKKRMSFPNLITDVGLDGLAIGNPIDVMIRYLAVGAGSTPPSPTDTGLEAEIARTSNDGGFSDTIGYEIAEGGGVEYYWRRRTRVFGEGEANGNITELGFFSSSGILWNRQLTRNELGEPEAITKTPEDQLRVVYEWRIYPPYDDVQDEVTVNGVPTSVTLRAAHVDASGLGWSEVTTELGRRLNSYVYASDRSTLLPRNATGFSGSTHSEGIYHAYVPGSFKIEREHRWGPSKANYLPTGVTWLTGNFWGPNARQLVQGLFSPGIPKDNTKRMIVMSTLTLTREEL